MKGRSCEYAREVKVVEECVGLKNLLEVEIAGVVEELLEGKLVKGVGLGGPWSRVLGLGIRQLKIL